MGLGGGGVCSSAGKDGTGAAAPGTRVDQNAQEGGPRAAGGATSSEHPVTHVHDQETPVDTAAAGSTASRLREHGEEAATVASANEGMTGATLALAQEVFAGTILSDLAGQTLSSVLDIAKEFPFLGPIVQVLIEFKGMVESYQEAQEECRRLVVWCGGLLGCIAKLYSGGGGDPKPTQHSLGLLDAAKDALTALMQLATERMEPSTGFTCGMFRSVVKFWKSSLFLQQCAEAKMRVNAAVECLMIDVAIDTKNGVFELKVGMRELQEGVRKLLTCTDLLTNMKLSMDQVKDGVGRLETGQREIKKGVDRMEEVVANLAKELGKRDPLFTEVLFQVDPALNGHAQQMEKMFSLAGRFSERYESHKEILLHGGVRVSNVSSGDIQKDLCRISSSCMVWSSQGCGWVSGSCPIKDVFVVFKSLLQAEVVHVKVVVVCHTYGARETAQQLLAAGVPVVVWINQALMQLEVASANTLLFNVIHPLIDAIVTGDAGDVTLIQKKLEDLLGKHLAGVSRLESAVLGRPVRFENARGSGTVVNALKLETVSNLTSSGEGGRKKLAKLVKELELAVCDVPYPSMLVDRMVEALGDGGGLWHVKGAGHGQFSRGRAVAFEASMKCLVNGTFAVVWCIESLANKVSLEEALKNHCTQGSTILIWIDVTKQAEWEDIGTWLVDDVLDGFSAYRVVLLLTCGESKELQAAALQLSEQLSFQEFLISDVKDASTSRAKAHSLHETLRFSFSEETKQCSPLKLLSENLLSEITLAGLLAKALPGIDGSASSEAQQVQIAGMYEDGLDLIVIFCVRDVGFLKNLSHNLLTGVLGKNLGESFSQIISKPDGVNGGVAISGANFRPPAGRAGPRTITVEPDMSHFAKNFEHAILALDKLTTHQTEKMDEVVKYDHVHLKAPAGAGKTFVALHLILLALSGPNGDLDRDIKILFVVKNEALALFVVKWLCTRCEGEVQKRMLERLRLLYQPCDAGPRVVKLDDVRGWLSTEPAPTDEKHDMIVIDEGHHVYSDESVRGTVEKYTAPLLASSRPDPPRGFPRFLILSDVSQSYDLNPQYPADLPEVRLTEVVRSSQRILAGAAAFQLDQPITTTCQNTVAGPPLKSVMFELKAGSDAPPDSERFRTYAIFFVQALVDHVLSTFPGLSLDDRVAVVVPNERFLEGFRACLGEVQPETGKGQLETLLAARLAVLEQRSDAESKVQMERIKKIREVVAMKLRVVSAAEASRYVPKRHARVETKQHGRVYVQLPSQMIVVDTVENFHGLERLIAIAVGLDEVGSPEDTIQSRARLYCAVTRAQLFVVVVNEFKHRGCLEFLGHVELHKEHRKVDSTTVNRTAATDLVQKAETEKQERLERWLASVGLGKTAAALKKVGVKGEDDLKHLREAKFEELMAAMEEADFDLLLENVGGLGHESAPASAKKLRETVAAREAQLQRQADLSRLDQQQRQEEEARVADELSKWLASVGSTAVAAALTKVGVKGKDDLTRLDEKAFEGLLAEMSDTTFDLLLENVKGLGHEGAPSSAEELREKMRETAAAQEAQRQRQAELSRLEQQRRQEEEARVADELSRWLASVGLTNPTTAAPALKKVGVKAKDDLKGLRAKEFEVLLAAMSEADFDLLLENVKGLGHESAPSSAAELRHAADTKKRQEAAAAKKAAPKLKTSIWDTSGNDALEATELPEFMPFGREKRDDDSLHLRLVVIGDGTPGKTSLVRAMQSESGTTEAIPLDERTIAIDVGRNWKIEWGGFPLVFETWDFGGQAAYRTLHSPFLSGRCLPILVFRSTLEDGQYLSAEQLMADFLRLWLQMLHAHIPSSQVVLVCTRWCSPPAGVAVEEHQARVSALCAAVTEAVADEMQSLNAQTVKELGDLRRQEEKVAKAIGAEEERTRASGNQTHAGGGKDKGGGHGLPGQSGEHQDLKELRSIAAQIEKRLRVVTAEPEAGSEGAAQAVSVELADGRVHCVESVGGDGSTAVAVRDVLVKCARALPFMGQNIPKGYTAVKDACVEHTWTGVAVRMDEAVEVLVGKCKGQTAASVREALEYWSLMGFVLVHDDWLLPRPTDMIDLVLPLVHHDLLAALEQTLSREARPAATKDASADWVVPAFAALARGEQGRVRAMVKQLMFDKVLCAGLLPHLKGWKDASEAERDALLGVLVQFGLVVSHDVEGVSGGDEREWLCTCRMNSRPPAVKDGWDTAQWKAFAGATEMVPVVRYTPDHVPSALFPHIVASQMCNRDYKAEHRRRQILQDCLLSVQLQATAERHEFFQLALTTGDDGAVQVVVVASTVGLLRSLCASIESVISRRFPGLSQDVDVQFSGPDGECVWKVGDDMTLGTILTRKDWERRVGVELVGNGERLDLKIRDIFKEVPGIFFSHSWNDHSTEVGPEIRDVIENRMRELVWFDDQMMTHKDQFRSLMTEGVKNAWVVFIFLSREALASGNCLREICVAREQQLTANTRVVVLAMEPEVTFAEILKWSTTKALTFAAKGGETRTVHARTVKWVQEHLLGVNIYTEWIKEDPKKKGAKPSEDQSKERRAKQSEAIDRVIENLRKPLGETMAHGTAPDFEVVREGDVWILGTKGSA